MGDVNYTVDPGGSTLEVVETLEQLKDKVPPQLFELVAKSADQPMVEDLDI